jgi:hypothetical protein
MFTTDSTKTGLKSRAAAGSLEAMAEHTDVNDTAANNKTDNLFPGNLVIMNLNKKTKEINKTNFNTQSLK